MNKWVGEWMNNDARKLCTHSKKEGRAQESREEEKRKEKWNLSYKEEYSLKPRMCVCVCVSATLVHHVVPVCVSTSAFVSFFFFVEWGTTKGALWISHTHNVFDVSRYTYNIVLLLFSLQSFIIVINKLRAHWRCPPLELHLALLLASLRPVQVGGEAQWSFTGGDIWGDCRMTVWLLRTGNMEYPVLLRKEKNSGMSPVTNFGLHLDWKADSCDPLITALWPELQSDKRME